MATVVDELITKFTLVDDQTAKTGKISGATQSLTNHINAAQQAQQRLTQSQFIADPVVRRAATNHRSLTDSISSLASVSDIGASVMQGLTRSLMMAGTALLTTGGILEEFFRRSYEKFAKFQTTQLGFEGFLGSAEKAKQMVDYLKAFSVGKPFQLMDLSHTALELTEISLSVNRFLPLITKMATGLGKVNAEGLEEIVELFRRIQGGETGLALGPRGVGRFGISRDVLKKYGAQFDKDEFIGSTTQAFDVLEKVIVDRFSRAADKVGHGAEAMLADFRDAVDKFEIQVGGEIATAVNPIVQNLSKAVTDLEEAGAGKTFVDSLMGALNFDGLELSQDSLTMAIAHLGGTIITLTAYLKAIYDTTGDMISRLKDTINKDPIYSRIAKAIGPTWLKPGDGQSAAENASDQGQSFVRQIELQLELLKKQRERDKKLGKKSPAAPETGAMTNTANTDTQYLQQIAENTKQSAMDLKKYALGGGDLGRLGVTATEMTGIRGAQSHLTAVGGHIGRNVMDSLNAMINDQINRALADYLRRGLGRGQ